MLPEDVHLVVSLSPLNLKDNMTCYAVWQDGYFGRQTAELSPLLQISLSFVCYFLSCWFFCGSVIYSPCVCLLYSVTYFGLESAFKDITEPILTFTTNSMFCFAWIHHTAIIAGEFSHPLEFFLMTPVRQPRTAGEHTYNKSHTKTCGDRADIWDAEI